MARIFPRQSSQKSRSVGIPNESASRASGITHQALFRDSRSGLTAANQRPMPVSTHPAHHVIERMRKEGFIVAASGDGKALVDEVCKGAASVV